MQPQLQEGGLTAAPYRSSRTRPFPFTIFPSPLSREESAQIVYSTAVSLILLSNARGVQATDTVLFEMRNIYAV